MRSLRIRRKLSPWVSGVCQACSGCPGSRSVPHCALSDHLSHGVFLEISRKRIEGFGLASLLFNN